MFWYSIILSCVCLIAAIVIVVTRIGFPYHRPIGFGVYLFGWLPFIYSLTLVDMWVFKDKTLFENIFSPLLGELLLGFVLIGAVQVLWSISRRNNKFFTGLSQNEITAQLQDDRKLLFYLDSRLVELTSNIETSEFLESGFIESDAEFKEKIKEFMFAYMEILFELDILRDRYSSYYTYSVFAKARGRIEFFINSYSALVIQHYSIYKILKKIKDKNLVAFLNQEFPEQQVAAGTYDRLKEQVGRPGEMIRLTFGRMCYFFVTKLLEVNYDVVENHLERLSDSISGHFWLIIKRPLDYFEKQSYKVWSPLMERAALRITFIRMTDREFHITAKQIQSYVGRLETGDILFERREWNANNLGIPGFWTHNALYVGTIDKLDRELQGVAELNGLSFSQYLQKENPDAYNKMLSRDKFGYEYAIIELKRGVIFESLEESTRADSLGVLRVKNLTASDKFNIVMEAMSHVGKPYDYDFDFSTDNALICSELTYKSHKVTGKLHADLRTVSGRPMISPNQLAEKFVQEYKRDSELEFVLFLDGDEKEGVAHEYGVDEFISSVSRPKWNAARQLVGSR